MKTKTAKRRRKKTAEEEIIELKGMVGRYVTLTAKDDQTGKEKTFTGFFRACHPEEHWGMYSVDLVFRVNEIKE